MHGKNSNKRSGYNNLLYVRPTATNVPSIIILLVPGFSLPVSINMIMM